MAFRSPKWPVLALLGLFFAMPAIASPTDPAAFTVSQSPNPAHPGEVVTLQVDAQIDSGWHLYSLIPTPPPGPAPAVITIAGSGIEPAGPVSETNPAQIYDPNFDKTVSYFRGKASFFVPVKITGHAGPVLCKLTISYQTCNDSVCLPPTEKTVDVPIDIVAGPVRPEYAHPLRATSETSGLGLFCLAAVFAGLLALITPCVFPLIPITLTSFVKQADGDKGRLVRIALTYSLGIIVLYTLVGLITALAAGAGGLQRIAANPYVNLFSFAVFVLFALSFFELLSINLPGSIGSLQSSAKSMGGWAGLALLGVVFVLASFTCTAPFIGTLLVSAASGTILKPIVGMVLFASAFVSPFVVFSFFPHWITKIPKSGIWLARVKATLGFVELAASLKFLSNADLFWQWKVLTEPVILSLWMLISAGAALYLLGSFKFGIVAETESYGAKVSPVRFAFSGAFGLFSLYCLWGLSGRPILPIISAFLPPSGYGGATDNRPIGVPWLSDYSTALAAASSQSKPLLIDFTGYTCTNCRLNENQVFPDPQVQAELAKFVRVQLYTDSGPHFQQNESLELAKFQDVSLPLYGIVDPATGQPLAKTAGVQSVASFLHFLTEADHPSEAATQSAWTPYTDSQLAAATSAGRPAIIDFTASWCTNCKAIEHDVFPDPAVVTNIGKFTTFRADLTNFGDPTNQHLEQRFSVASLPTIIFIRPNGTEVPGTRVTGLLTASEFASRMRKALGQ